MAPDARSGPPVTTPESRLTDDQPAARKAKSLATVGHESDGRTYRGRLTPDQRRWSRQILVLLRASGGAMTAAELAAKLSAEPSALKPVIGLLYGQRRVDFAAGYVVLAAHPAPARGDAG